MYQDALIYCTFNQLLLSQRARRHVWPKNKYFFCFLDVHTFSVKFNNAQRSNLKGRNTQTRVLTFASAI